MSESDDKVMALVERELKKNPDAETQALYDKAAKADESIKELTLRQFNARYPLQVKRALAPKKPRRKKTSRSRSATKRKSSKQEVKRSRIRDVFLKFARDLVDAEGKYEAIDVIAGVDRYVDEVLEVT